MLLSIKKLAFGGLVIGMVASATAAYADETGNMIAEKVCPNASIAQTLTLSNNHNLLNGGETGETNIPPLSYYWSKTNVDPETKIGTGTCTIRDQKTAKITKVELIFQYINETEVMFQPEITN